MLKLYHLLNSYVVESRISFRYDPLEFLVSLCLLEECVRHTTMMVVGLLGNCFIQFEIFVYIALFFFQDVILMIHGHHMLIRAIQRY